MLNSIIGRIGPYEFNYFMDKFVHSYSDNIGIKIYSIDEYSICFYPTLMISITDMNRFEVPTPDGNTIGIYQTHVVSQSPLILKTILNCYYYRVVDPRIRDLESKVGKLYRIKYNPDRWTEVDKDVTLKKISDGEFELYSVEELDSLFEPKESLLTKDFFRIYDLLKYVSQELSI